MQSFNYSPDNLFAEVCCGSAKLSFCMNACGIKTLSVDYDRNRHETWMPNIKLNLADVTQAQVLLDLALNKKIAVAWFALPCGTCSRARDIRLPGQSFLPRPLRSLEFPRGLVGLSSDEQSRVDAANQIYDNMYIVIRALLSVGAYVIIENPSRSWIWSIPEYQALLGMNFADVEFQHCRWSGDEPSRNKWTRLRSNVPQLIELAGPCKAAHPHLPWGKAGNSFATANEAEYPMAMCESVAKVLVSVLGLSESADAPGNLTEFSPHKLRRLTALRQPRGRRFPALMTEFGAVLTLPETAPPSPWHRELRHFYDKGADGSEVCERFRVVGVWRDPEQYIKEALTIPHPVDFVESVPQPLREAISFLLSSSESEYVQNLVSQIRCLTKLVHDNKLADQQAYERLPDFAKPLMKGKHLSTLQSLLDMFRDDWPDQALAKDIVKGFRLTGTQPYTGIFDHEPLVGTMSIEQLRTTSDINNTALLNRTRSSGDVDLDMESWEKTMEEQSVGWLRGPFYSIADLQLELNGQVPHLSRRFSIRQSGKIRLIDDYLESNINATYACEDKLVLMDVDSITAVMRLLEASLVGEESVLSGLSLSRVNPKWKQSEWQGTTIDLKAAYKQLFVDGEDHWASCVTVFDPHRQMPALFLQIALPFGASSSVLNFNRAGRFLWHVGTRLCRFVWGNFFDDYPIFSSSTIAKPTLAAATLLFEILGWQISKGEKQMDFAAQFTALGVTFDVGRMPFNEASVYNSPKRTAAILSLISDLRSSVKITHRQMESIRGKLQFVESNTFGKVGKAIYTALFKNTGFPLKLTTRETRLFKLLTAWLTEARPRKVSPIPNLPPALIFTDGACEPDGSGPPCTTSGGLLVDPIGPRQVFGLRLSDETITPWMTGSKRQLVTEAELSGVYIALREWAHHLSMRRVFLFIDSEPSLFALIRGTSETDSCARIVHACHKLIEAHQLFLWIIKIPSKSNPADEPSRLDINSAAYRYSATVISCDQPVT